jgi:ferrous iron transport protein B
VNPTVVLLRKATIALVGNPNTGKTTLFNALAGMRQRVGNYPGVTVETKKGTMRLDGEVYELVDLPGTYSLAPKSPDEMLAVDLILGQQGAESGPDVVVVIVDASNLERNLYLTTQVMELGVPVVIALNMIDLAEGQGIRIDSQLLETRLGVPVIPIQANKSRGLDRLKQAISKTIGRQPVQIDIPFPETFEREVSVLRRSVDASLPPYLLRRLILDAGGVAEQRFRALNGEDGLRQLFDARQRLALAGYPLAAIEARARYKWIREMLAGCVERPKERPLNWTDRLDRILTHRIWGTLIFIAVMFAVFEAIFTGARPFMKAINLAKDLVGESLHNTLPPGPLSSLLVDGILEGVGSVLVFLPQIVILFGFIAILEDCGYMARAAFLMDKLMSRCGLNGKSFIPMLSSVACAVPGIMATRVIENRRDRLATILVAPLMSCSARLPVYTLLIGAFLTEGFAWWVPGLTMFAMYSVGLITAPLVALLLKRSLLRGETPPFVMEMPLYKWPSLRVVLRRMADSGWAFTRRAGTLILAVMIIVWALLYFPRHDAQGGTYDARVAELQSELDRLTDERTKSEGDHGESLQRLCADKQATIDQLYGEWKRQSILGRLGQFVEPAVRPLGWDWRIGMAVLASFPAREVVVGTLGIIYNEGKVDTEEIRQAENVGATKLASALRSATWETKADLPVFTVPVALSLMVFFALCCQCASTLAVIRRETGSWRWPAFTFAYMTGLAYFAAFVVYRIGALLV